MSDSMHANATTLKKMYTHLIENHIDQFLGCWDERTTFQVFGKSALAGKFTKQSFGKDFFELAKRLSNDTYKIELHDVMATDLHGTALATVSVMRNNQKIEFRTVHVWRFDQGKPIAGYEYTRDLYQFDTAWES